MMFTFCQFTVNGVVNWIGKNQSLEEVQGLVGGYIAPIKLVNNEMESIGFVNPLNDVNGHYVMMVDEEGLLKEKEFNRTASLIAGQTIVGNVVLVWSEPNE
jgi:hypothetical protein